MTSEPGKGSGRAAFFDVDETLITVKSMFHFLEFYLDEQGEPPSTYHRLTAELHRMAAAGTPRQHVNRHYYGFFAGHSEQRLARAGRDWFDRQLASGGLFVPEPVARLAGHVRAGDFVMLLSGSFFACLDPIAEHLGAHWAMGTRPRVRRGVLTGEVLAPMIGAAKGRAARATMAVRGLDPAWCSAYGDHSSDLDLLLSVGRPVVVGSDTVLTGYAARDGWERIASDRLAPAVPAPRQAVTPAAVTTLAAAHHGLTAAPSQEV
ncbi:HAD family hydrolase [Streptomyces sp.]|uniref:HAD family hydrolase n=1 Tax=Streptomyces sp. TaxID=1931 RepID=UPI002F3F32DB